MHNKVTHFFFQNYIRIVRGRVKVYGNGEILYYDCSTLYY